ncbi:nucleotidyl transferase AbiEii/AbiGii toxin family protein [Chondrinema litorale]|uniref:nucleotidyl transferase AbiEii/AbiGii toxin family protein n=1 Tax=Chondrinema litorale TaxID=2994555 RepID=UPI002543017B|nr:nucleotidyl transferase AbiEii/AbiGii toxin family protein [Chondrinema litorale]UZR94884.1 hypothetical protein OQ292_03530 [Chondrinema litorale]
MQHYLQLFKSLYKARVEYLVCGGLAVNIYGIPRMTADIDLMLRFSPNNLKKFKEVTTKLSYNACIPVDIEKLVDETVRKDMVEKKNLIAYSYYNSIASFMNLDILVKTPKDFEYFWSNKETRDIEDFEVYLVSLQNLIEMKKYAGRGQDEQDIQLLYRLGNLNN